MGKEVADFVSVVLAALEGLYGPDEIETLVRWEPLDSPGAGADAAVKVVHRPTGRSAMCDDFDSQKKNKVVALVRLRALLDRPQRSDPSDADEENDA